MGSERKGSRGKWSNFGKNRWGNKKSRREQLKGWDSEKAESRVKGKQGGKCYESWKKTQVKLESRWWKRRMERFEISSECFKLKSSVLEDLTRVH